MRKLAIFTLALLTTTAFAGSAPNSASTNEQQAYVQGIDAVATDSVSSPTCKTKVCENDYLNGVQNAIDQESQDRLS